MRAAVTNVRRTHHRRAPWDSRRASSDQVGESFQLRFVRNTDFALIAFVRKHPRDFPFGFGPPTAVPRFELLSVARPAGGCTGLWSRGVCVCVCVTRPVIASLRVMNFLLFSHVDGSRTTFWRTNGPGFSFAPSTPGISTGFLSWILFRASRVKVK